MKINNYEATKAKWLLISSYSHYIGYKIPKSKVSSFLTRNKGITVGF